MQVGIDSFAAAFDENSRAVNPAERLRQLVQQIEHADEVGLDAFGVGEHHRREFLDSAPAVILGAAAARTQRIRLTSAVLSIDVRRDERRRVAIRTMISPTLAVVGIAVATINGSPSWPVRTNDCGVPPTPSQIGSGFCTGRG